MGKAAQKPSGIMGRVMFFLLRMGFWLTVVCVLLPNGGAKTTSPDAQIDAVQAVSLASAAMSGISTGSHCVGKPSVASTVTTWRPGFWSAHARA